MLTYYVLKQKKKKLKYFSNKFNKKNLIYICSPWVESFNKWNIQ